MSHSRSTCCFFIFFALALLPFQSCTKDGSQISQPIKPKLGRKEPLQPSEQMPSVGGGQLTADCEPLRGDIRNIPFFFKHATGGFFVTRASKPCNGPDRVAGMEKDSSWMAMGVPCSGGKGKIVLARPFNNPKMVTLVASTHCAMSPATQTEVESQAVTQLGVPPTAQLFSYVPLMIQYWELVGYSDADVGDQIYLRIPDAMQIGWPAFNAGKPLRVYLYGRENAWVQENILYFVEADLYKESGLSFRLQVIRGRALNDEEVKKVAARCRALRPRRNCQEIF